MSFWGKSILGFWVLAIRLKPLGLTLLILALAFPPGSIPSASADDSFRPLYRRVADHMARVNAAGLEAERNYRYGQPHSPERFRNSSPERAELLQRIYDLLREMRAMFNPAERVAEAEGRSPTARLSQYESKLQMVATLWQEFSERTFAEEGRQMLIPKGVEKTSPTTTLLCLIDFADFMGQAAPAASEQAQRGERAFSWAAIRALASQHVESISAVSMTAWRFFNQLIEMGIVENPWSYVRSNGSLQIRKVALALVQLRKQPVESLNAAQIVFLKDASEKIDLLIRELPRLERMAAWEEQKWVDPRKVKTAEALSAGEGKTVRIIPVWLKILLFPVQAPHMPSPVAATLSEMGFKGEDLFLINHARRLSMAAAAGAGVSMVENFQAGSHFVLAKFFSDLLLTKTGWVPQAMAQWQMMIDHYGRLAASLTGWFYLSKGADLVLGEFALMKEAQATFRLFQSRLLGVSADPRLLEMAAAKGGGSLMRSVLITGLRGGISFSIASALMQAIEGYCSHPDHRQVEYLVRIGMRPQAAALLERIKEETYWNGTFLGGVAFAALFFTVTSITLNIAAMHLFGQLGAGALFAGIPASMVGLLISVVALAGYSLVHHKFVVPILLNNAHIQKINEMVSDYEATAARMQQTQTLLTQLDTMLKACRIESLVSGANAEETRVARLAFVRAALEGRFQGYLDNLIIQQTLNENPQILKAAPPKDAGEALQVAVQLIHPFQFTDQYRVMGAIYHFHLMSNYQETMSRWIEADEFRKQVQKNAPEIDKPEYAPIHEFFRQITRYQSQGSAVQEVFEAYRQHLATRKLKELERAHQTAAAQIEQQWDRERALLVSVVQSDAQRLRRLLTAIYYPDRLPADQRSDATAYLARPENTSLVKALLGKSPIAMPEGVVALWTSPNGGFKDATFFSGPEKPRDSFEFKNFIAGSTFDQLISGAHGDSTDVAALNSATAEVGLKLGDRLNAKLAFLRDAHLAYLRNEYYRDTQTAARSIEAGDDVAEEHFRRQLLQVDIKDEKEDTALEKAKAIGNNWASIIAGFTPNTTWTSLYSSEMAYWASRWWSSAAESTNSSAAAWIAFDQRDRLYRTFVNALNTSFLVRALAEDGGVRFVDLWTHQDKLARYLLAAISDPLTGVDPKLSSPVLKDYDEKLRKLLRSPTPPAEEK